MKIYRVRGRGRVNLTKIVEEYLIALPDGSTKMHIIEHRRDPLTGQWCRINVKRALREYRPKLEEVVSTVSELASKTEHLCPFCHSRVRESTPRFTQLDRDMLHHGTVLIVPNMYPFGKFHSIAVLDPMRHFRKPWDLYEVILDLLILCQDYFEKIIRIDSGQTYQYVNMNFLFPAGASAVHPHAQIVASRRPTNIHRIILLNSKRYSKLTGRNLILDYVDTELTLKERVILEEHNIVVYAPFAPHVNYEVHIVDKSHRSLQELSFSDIKLLSKVICNIISTLCVAFHQFSFNLAIYSIYPEARLSKYNLLLTRIGFRKEPYAMYVNDVGFMELLHYEPVISTYPEEYAYSLRSSLPRGPS